MGMMAALVVVTVLILRRFSVSMAGPLSDDTRRGFCNSNVGGSSPIAPICLAIGLTGLPPRGIADGGLRIDGIL
jgi:hypothetical protein